MPEKNPPTTIPVPNGICPECLADEANTFTFVPTRTVLVSYCSHHQCGGILHMRGLGGPFWTLYTPMDRETFDRLVVGSLEERGRQEH